MHTPVTLLTATLLAPLFLYLSLLVIAHRRKNKISLGHADDSLLEKKVRAHGNFTEYAPMLLLWMYMLEANGISAPVLYAMSILLILGRYLHAYAFTASKPMAGFRTAGMACTFLALMISMLSLGYLYLDLA